MVEIKKNTEVYILGQPGEMFKYSNEAYALLQTIIEEASGEDFLTYMDKHVFEPLQMNRSTFLQAKLEEMDNRSEEQTSELQSRGHIVCRLLLERKSSAMV